MPLDQVDAVTDEVLQFALEFMSLKRLPGGKYRMTRGVPDLMHTMGYYSAQAKRTGDDNATRLTKLAVTIQHIAANLQT